MTSLHSVPAKSVSAGALFTAPGKPRALRNTQHQAPLSITQQELVQRETVLVSRRRRQSRRLGRH